MYVRQLIFKIIEYVVSYARCDWSVTSGYANTVVTSQHISQTYFIKIENGHPMLFVFFCNCSLAFKVIRDSVLVCGSRHKIFH